MCHFICVLFKSLVLNNFANIFKGHVFKVDIYYFYKNTCCWFLLVPGIATMQRQESEFSRLYDGLFQKNIYSFDFPPFLKSAQKILILHTSC